MSISAILPTTLNFPHRGTLVQDEFVLAQEASQDVLAGSWTTQANLLASQANDLSTDVNTKASQVSTNAANAAISAATATAKASQILGYVVPTGSTNSLETQNWHDTMMSKAEFNAVAAERRANRAGSGFDEFGRGYLNNVNEGISIDYSLANSFFTGRRLLDGVGTSKTSQPYVNINGIISKVYSISDSAGERSVITLPPAPTVLPSTATLTQQQIDSGVIKHADASNSGLITGGTGLTGTTFSQVITTVNGKKYTIEYVDNAVRKTLDVTATASTYTVSLSGTDITQVAVFPADAISRSDLVFLESWHEDISGLDFVYPLGNVQYLGTTGDCGTTVAGAFAGYGTYSLFSDTWQADNALIGKGYVWSTLSDSNKKAFVANPENNCYLDGDKVIQVRYRMRVVMGLGDNWANVSTQVNAAPTNGAITYITYTNGAVVAKGKQVSSADLGSYSTASVYWGSYNTTKVGFDSGVAYSFKSSTPDDSSISYNNTSLMIHIDLVHRRNTGIKHDTYNPNGTKLASDSLDQWFTTVPFTSIADCFTDSKLLTASGYIGTTTGRADGLFYDQIHESDITDLRMSSRVPTDYNRLIDKEFNRLVAGTYRGTEGEKSSYYVTAATPTLKGGGSTNIYIKFSTSIVPIGLGVLTTAQQPTIGIFIDSSGTRYDISGTHSSDGSYVYLQGSYGNIATNVNITGTCLVYLYAGSSTRTKSNTITHTDIIGSPSNYPTAWKQSGVSGTPLIVAEDGTSLLPTSTTGYDGLPTFKLSRKANATPLQVLKSTDSGVTWTALAVTTNYTFSTTTNAITFVDGDAIVNPIVGRPLASHLIRVTYQTKTNMAIPAVNSEVLAIGDGISTNAYNIGLGSALLNSLIGKTSTSTSGARRQLFKLIEASFDSETKKLQPDITFGTTLNGAVTLNKLDSPAVKVFPYLTRSNGKAYLSLVFKEMKYGSYAAPTVVTAASATYTQNMTYKINIAGCALDGKVIQWIAATATSAIDWSLYDVSPTGVIYLLSSGVVYANARLYDGDAWGDDSKFNIVDNVSTTTDTNGATVLIGQKKVELPYFIGAAE